MTTTMIPLATRVEPKLRAEVRDYQRQYAEIPPLAAVVRELIELGLRAAQQQARREKKTT